MSVIPLKVAVRVRPLISKETNEGCQTCLNFIPGEQQIILGKDRSFTFDFVFRPTDPQYCVYEDAVQPLLKHIFKGYNATVLAYGQTGSGKTFTMGGGYEDSLKMDPDGMGIIPRIIQEIFQIISETEDREFNVNVSYLEIINEELQDLLVSGKKDPLTIREENGEIKTPGLREVSVASTHETMRCLEQGCNNRTTAATAMNNTSSRSHAIFSIYIEQKHKEDSNDYWKGKLQLVDLAGSERIKKTRASGERLKEGININKGLLSLGNVISILGDEKNQKTKTHVPYRDSKLTRILQDSLGGNSHTLMIACASPADSNMEETLNTLRYADRARKIKNKPVVNMDPKTAEIMTLKNKVQELTMKLISAGLSDLAEEALPMTAVSSSPARNREHAENLEKWMRKCQALEEEVESLSRELRQSVDQAASASERAIKWEMKCERLKNRLKDLESNIGVDIDLLSSSMVDTSPVISEQLEKLKAFACKLQDSLNTEDAVSTADEEENDENEGEEMETEETEVVDDPETREMAKQHTLRRAKLNTELQELNKILERKEKIANQYSMNDNKMAELREQYQGDMKQLEDKINNLEKEKDTLSTALEDAKVNQVANKISEQRRKKLQDLETRMTDLRKQLMEQKRMLKLKEQKEKEATKMNTEIVALKQQRVKLMKRMKEDADTWRKWRQQKDKEVLQLQQKDRKRQFEIQKLQRENQRTHSVLQRKSEEAAAANRRLKEAMMKQKKVMEDRTQKFEKCDKTVIGNRVRKWLSHELDVKVGIMEAKYHRESQLQDRKTLAESLKTLKDTIKDEDPITEENKAKIQHLENQIEVRNVQISDLQQKILDAEQEGKGKSAKDNLHTMMEAKIALKWLLDQAVSFKADNGRVRLDMAELRQTISEDDHDNDEYILELEEKLEDLQKKHKNTVLKMQREHQKEIEIILASTTNQATDMQLQKRLEIQKQELTRLNELEEQLKEKTRQCEKLEKRLTKYMYQDKNMSLLPRLPDDNLTVEERSPFLSPRPKPPRIGKNLPKMKHLGTNFSDSDEDDEDVVNGDDVDQDPDWQQTPLYNAEVRQLKNKRRRTHLFDQDNRRPKRLSDGKGCRCRLSCKTKRCICRKSEAFCSDTCKCMACDNQEIQLPNSTTGEMDVVDEGYTPDNSAGENSVGSSVMNTTFEVEPSTAEESNSSMENKPSTSAAAKPPKPKRQTSVLGLVQAEPDIRSSDEFEKPRLMKKSVSAGMMRQKRSSAEMKRKSESEEDVSAMLESFTKKKRKLINPSKKFFNPV